MFRSLLVVTAVVLSACGNPSLVDGKNYKTACSLPADCAAVVFGDQCEPCACANAAISTTEKVKYDADHSAALATCGGHAPVLCSPCATQVLTCTSGVCGIQ